MRRTVAMVATSALAGTLIAGLPVTGTASPSAGTRTSAAETTALAGPPRIAWTRCGDGALRAAGARCGRLAVPLDHADPGGRKISIAVSRIKATAPASRRQGPLLINPGGPGGRGLDMAASMARDLPRSVASTYDLIGFDPRGVGASSPALRCKANYARGPRPAYRPVTGPAQRPGPNERRWLARSKSYADACAKRYPKLLPFLRTEDAARDLDVLRQALGAAKINYYGYSYGTYLGSVYATLFPTRTRRLVFDGVVDPRNVWYAGQLAQDRAFETALRRFWAWAARYHGTYRLGTSATAVRKRYYAEERALKRRAIGPIGPAEWNDVFLAAGYAQFTWPRIARAWAAWERGASGAIRQLYAEDIAASDNSYAMYLAVQCTDASWPAGYATWRRDAFRTARTARFETWGNLWFNAPCLYWGAPARVPVSIDGSRTPSLLLVSSTLDGATPYAGAVYLRRLFRSSALVAQVGSTTHSDSLNGNACVDRVVIRYLRGGSLPARDGGSGADVRCRRSPLPRP